MSGQAKALLSSLLSACYRASAPARQNLRRLQAHAMLSSSLTAPVDASVVVLGRAQVYGTGNIFLGRNQLLYPGLYLETQDGGRITVGDGAVLSTGVHIVSMAGIVIGKGTMIGEYCSIRDANHSREPGMPIRNSGHVAKPILIGSEVWIGRGVTVLGGVTIGDGATVGANAVVTHDVPPGATVAGVPARAIAPPTKSPMDTFNHTDF